MPPRVTPAGVRAGLPEALAGLVELRGSAVHAYAGAVAQTEGALAAAAEAMAGFRSHVVQATDLSELNPDSILLHAVRRSSAARAPRPAEPSRRLRRVVHRGGSACELMPRLLAARANRELSQHDAVRLDRHLASCPGCRELRDCFRTAENLYAEAAGTPLAERDARALLVALAGAAPLASGTAHSIAQDALALLPAEAVSRPGRARAAPPPTEARVARTPPETTRPPSRVDATPPQTRPPDPWPTDPRPTDPRPTDPWPTDPAAAEARPAANPAPADGSAAENASRANGPGASADSSSARHSARIGTTPGRVSFGRRTVVIRSGIERSGPPAASVEHGSQPPILEREPPEPQPEPGEQRPAVTEAAHDPSRAEQESSPAPEPAVPPAPRHEPAGPQPAPDGDRLQAPEPALLSAAQAGAPTSAGGPGAPPDSGTLARVIPGVLIVMAIGIALLIAGIVGAGTPATTDDIEPPELVEPVRDRGATGTGRMPEAPGTEPQRTPTGANGALSGFYVLG